MEDQICILLHSSARLEKTMKPNTVSHLVVEKATELLCVCVSMPNEKSRQLREYFQKSHIGRPTEAKTFV